MIHPLTFLFVFIFCFEAFSQQITADSNFFPVKKYNPELLKDFDFSAACNKARTMSNKVAEQKEYVESRIKQHIFSKTDSNKNHSHKSEAKTIYKTYSPSLNNSNCPNAGFENLDFSNWLGGTYSNYAGVCWDSLTPPWVSGALTMGINTPRQAVDTSWSFPHQNRQTIMTIPPVINNPPYNITGWDSIAINPLTHLSEIEFVPANSNGVTCRLGNAGTYETERLVYTINVDSQNTYFSYSYALVYFDGTHANSFGGLFEISCKDQSGNIIGGPCGNFKFNDSSVFFNSGFQEASYYRLDSNKWVDPPPLGQWHTFLYYKKWSTHG